MTQNPRHTSAPASFWEIVRVILMPTLVYSLLRKKIIKKFMEDFFRNKSKWRRNPIWKFVASFFSKICLKSMAKDLYVFFLK
jgi:hypothetical protein